DATTIQSGIAQAQAGPCATERPTPSANDDGRRSHSFQFGGSALGWAKARPSRAVPTTPNGGHASAFALELRLRFAHPTSFSPGRRARAAFTQSCGYDATKNRHIPIRN